MKNYRQFSDNGGVALLGFKNQNMFLKRRMLVSFSSNTYSKRQKEKNKERERERERERESPLHHKKTTHVECVHKACCSDVGKQLLLWSRLSTFLLPSGKTRSKKGWCQPEEVGVSTRKVGLS